MPGGPAPTVLSHWSRLFEGLSASPLGFYKSVEQAVERRQLPDTSRSRVDWHEGGVLSAKREYLRVERGRLVFDICGAPYGNGFFVSWWLGRLQSPYGPVALVALTVGIIILAYVMAKVAGILLALVLLPILAPLLLWIFAHYVASQEAGWDDALVAMPILGSLYQRWFSPETYYRIDTTLMFQSSVQAAVNEVVDDLSRSSGLPLMSEFERKPILREFLGK